MEAVNLTLTQAHQYRSGINCEMVIREINHHTQPAQLPIAHLDHPHPRTSPRTFRRQCASVTFLSGAYTPCRSPFEKSLFLPVRNVAARKVDMTPAPPLSADGNFCSRKRPPLSAQAFLTRRLSRHGQPGCYEPSCDGSARRQA